MNPTDRKYTKEHEWILPSADEYLIGITEFAQSELGDIVYLELPETEDTLEAGDQICVIESVKAVANVDAPFGCTITAVNEALEDTPEAVNENPYDSWIVKVVAEDAKMDDWMTAEEYTAFISEE